MCKKTKLLDFSKYEMRQHNREEKRSQDPNSQDTGRWSENTEDCFCLYS